MTSHDAGIKAIRNRTGPAFLLAFALLLFTTPLLAALKPFDAEYAVYRNRALIAESRLSLQLALRNTFRFHLHTEPVGWLSMFYREKADETSVVSEQNGTLRPHDYLKVRRSGKKIKKRTHIVFDWTHNKILVPDEPGTPPRDIPGSAQDKHSMQLAVMHDLALGKRKNLQYTAVDYDRIKTYHFNILGEETVDTPLGIYRAIKVERVRKKSDGKMLIWFAPELDYLPVRMEEHQEDGTLYRSVLKRLRTTETSSEPHASRDLSPDDSSR